jgi:hypothetical protein
MAVFHRKMAASLWQPVGFDFINLVTALIVNLQGTMPLPQSLEKTSIVLEELNDRK